jgi:hypothetical protein
MLRTPMIDTPGLNITIGAWVRQPLPQTLSTGKFQDRSAEGLMARQGPHTQDGSIEYTMQDLASLAIFRHASVQHGGISTLS